MEIAFDLRLPDQREALADLLPEIDSVTLNILRDEFIKSLEDLAFYLKNPEWMIYQYGTFKSIKVGEKEIFHFTLSQAIELGLFFGRLSNYPNFDIFLKGFFNPTQFLDSLFEARVACFLSSLPKVKEIYFSPEYEVRGKVKRPDFDVIKQNGRITVECKSVEPFLSQVRKKFDHFLSILKNAMDEYMWPEYLRLEIEIISPFREKYESIAKKIVNRALIVNEKGGESFSEGPINGFVVRRDKPFCITDVSLGHDVVIVGNTPTGLFNHETTSLRVAYNRKFPQLFKSIGKCINKALKQLPKDNDCLIFIEEVPFSIAEIACKSRLSEPEYYNVKAIGVYNSENYKLIYRKPEREFIKELGIYRC